jgi:glycosyltransferase involved in cell wall biosynthesis
MHVVFLNQYYPPDAAPTGVVLRDLTEEMAKDGHEVTVLCASGGYAAGIGSRRERASLQPSPVRVLRIGATRFGRGSHLGKLLDYASYYLGVCWRLLVMRPRPERVVALTTPPYLSVLARLLTKLRGADHAHWVMDLYPDVMVAHGMLRGGSLPQRLLAALGRWGMGGGRCAAVVTLGPDMAERVTSQVAGNPARVSWVPLWAGVSGENEEAEAAMELRRKRGWKDDELVVMYSGNMGLGHRFTEILAAALAMRNEPVRFVLCGGGRKKPELEEFVRKHPACRVELRDYAAADELAAHLRSADVHLASLEEAWTGTMVPSKLQGIFAAGRPVIFIGAGESSIGRWVRESGAGWCVPAGDNAGFSAALREAAQPAIRAEMAAAALRFAKNRFDRRINAARVAAALLAPR